MFILQITFLTIGVFKCESEIIERNDRCNFGLVVHECEMKMHAKNAIRTSKAIIFLVIREM